MGTYDQGFSNSQLPANVFRDWMSKRFGHTAREHQENLEHFHRVREAAYAHQLGQEKMLHESNLRREEAAHNDYLAHQRLNAESDLRKSEAEHFGDVVLPKVGGRGARSRVTSASVGGNSVTFAPPAKKEAAPAPAAPAAPEPAAASKQPRPRSSSGPSGASRRLKSARKKP